MQSIMDSDTITEEWVIEQYCKMGFSAAQTLKLLEIRADHHEVHKMLKAGCPHQLVVEILR